MKTNRCTRTIPTLTMVAALLIGAQTEVQAAASGSVTATVQINIAPAPVACITLNKTALSFNPVTALSPSNAGQINAATVIVTNCGGAAHLSLSTTNMTGGGVTWAPVNGNVCNNVVDKYDLFADSTNHIVVAATVLTNSLAASPASREIPLNFTPPCTGSSIPAAGTDMSFTVTFAASLV